MPRCSRCPRCRCAIDPVRLAQLLALREEAIARGDADWLPEIDADLRAIGLAPPANDNQPR